MEFTLGQLSQLLEGELVGESEIKVHTISKIEEAQNGSGSHKGRALNSKKPQVIPAESLGKSQAYAKLSPAKTFVISDWVSSTP